MRHAAIGLLCVALASCGTFGRDDDKTPGPAPLPEVAGSATLKKVWDFDTGAGAGEQALNLVPALSGDVVYVADPDGEITALDTAKGDRIWRVDIDLPISGAVGAGEGVVLVGTPDGQVVALDSRNGERLWMHEVSSEVLVPPVPSAGVVVVRTVDGKLLGLRATDGEEIWSYTSSVPSLTLRGSSTPLAQEGIVIAGFANGKVIAADVRSGRVLWDTNVASPRGRNEVERMIDIDATPLLLGSVLYISAYQGNVTALALGSRRVLWSRDLSGYADLGADNENIYLSDQYGNVYALNRLSGSTVWKQEALQRRWLSGPIALRDYVAVGDFEGYVHLLDKKEGTVAARIKVGGGGVLAQLPDGDNKLIALSGDGRLTSIAVTRGGS